MIGGYANGRSPAFETFVLEPNQVLAGT